MKVWKTILSHGINNYDKITINKIFSVNDLNNAFKDIDQSFEYIHYAKLITINHESKSLSFSDIQKLFIGAKNNRNYWVQKGLLNLQNQYLENETNT